MSLEYDVRPIKVWPADWKRHEPPTRYSPFSASFGRTEALLERELRHLSARDVIVQIDVEERMLRLDGTLRASAQPGDPGVILSFTTPKFGALSYPCRAFAGRWEMAGWQANLRAIGLGLEALRMVERYGIAERGQQYAGFAELGTGIALGPGAMTREEAAKVLYEGSMDEDGAPWCALEDLLEDDEAVRGAYLCAAKLHHPDVEGDDERMKRIVQARDVLVAA